MAMKPSTALPNLSTAAWTTRVIFRLWKLALLRARKLRKQSSREASPADDAMTTPSIYTVSTDEEKQSEVTDDEDDDMSIMREAARTVVASGVVTLADLEKVTGLRLSKENSEDDDEGEDAYPVKEDDTASFTSTSGTDCSSVDGGDYSETPRDYDDHNCSDPSCVEHPTAQFKIHKSVQRPDWRRMDAPKQPSRWVCIGYGRYMRC